MPASTDMIQAVLQAVTQASPAIPDTVVAFTVPERSWLYVIGTIAQAILAIAVLVVAAGIGIVLWQIQQLMAKATDLLEKIQGETGPLVANANKVVDNVNDIAQKVKKKVEEADETLTHANLRVREVVDDTADRAAQFNALVKAMQDEADDAFVKSRSTLRGVKTAIKTAFRRSANEDDDPNDASDDPDDERHPDDDRPRNHRGDRGPRVKPKSENEYEANASSE